MLTPPVGSESMTVKNRIHSPEPCGEGAWQLAAAKHTLVLDGTEWRCSRCLLQVRPQHSAQTERQACPVGECRRGGDRWMQGEAGLRELFGRVRCFRQYCTPEGDEEPPTSRHRAGEDPGHQGGAAPGTTAGGKGASGALAHAAAAGVQCRPPSGSASTSGGAEAGELAAVGDARLGQANPLAAAHGAEERRQLKHAAPAAVKLPPSDVKLYDGACPPATSNCMTELAPSGQSAAAQADWADLAQRLRARQVARAASESAAEPAAGTSAEACRASGAVEPPVAPAHLPVATAAMQHQQRQGTFFATGVGPFSGQTQPAFLQAYEGHAVAFAGRSLWCLKCFEVPRSAHRSWRNGRCGGVRPPTAMPPALRDAVLRQPAACSKLHASIRARWAELAGALRLQ